VRVRVQVRVVQAQAQEHFVLTVQVLVRWAPTLAQVQQVQTVPALVQVQAQGQVMEQGQMMIAATFWSSSSACLLLS